MDDAFKVIQTLNFYLSEHPSIVGFRWSHTQSWGSTWSFIFMSIAIYIVTSLLLHLLLSIFLCHTKHIPLGPLPALHSLTVSIVSTIIFLGILLSTVSEIKETRWFWRRSKTPLQWLLCFPLGTRPSGRVFFWSYIFYLSRFLHMFITFFAILRRRKLVFLQLFYHSISTLMSFLWLEFSQSFQVLAILFTTLAYCVMHGHRFWTAFGLGGASLPLVLNFQMVLLGCNLVCHVGVLLLHLFRGGCNGIGAWVFNSILNGVILLLFVNFYVRANGKKKKNEIVGDCSLVLGARNNADTNKLKSN